MHKTIFKTQWFELKEIINPLSQKEIFYGIKAPDYVTCVPFDNDDKIILVSQFRPVINRFSLETPGGQVDNGQNPLEAIRNELIEETGYDFESIEKIASLDPDVGRLMNKLHIFKATGPKKLNPNIEEGIIVEKYTIEELKELIEKELFTSAYSILALKLSLDNLCC